jgi:hypothetical protein
MEDLVRGDRGERAGLAVARVRDRIREQQTLCACWVTVTVPRPAASAAPADSKATTTARPAALTTRLDMTPLSEWPRVPTSKAKDARHCPTALDHSQ